MYALNYYNYIDQIIKLNFILMFVLNEYYKSIESSKLDNVKYIQLLFGNYEKSDYHYK